MSKQKHSAAFFAWRNSSASCAKINRTILNKWLKRGSLRKFSFLACTTSNSERERKGGWQPLWFTAFQCIGCNQRLKTLNTKRCRPTLFFRFWVFRRVNTMLTGRTDLGWRTRYLNGCLTDNDVDVLKCCLEITFSQSISIRFLLMWRALASAKCYFRSDMNHIGTRQLYRSSVINRLACLLNILSADRSTCMSTVLLSNSNIAETRVSLSWSDR